MADSTASTGDVAVDKKCKPNMTTEQCKELATYFQIRSTVGANGIEPEKGTSEKRNMRVAHNRARFSRILCAKARIMAHILFDTGVIFQDPRKSAQNSPFSKVLNSKIQKPRATPVVTWDFTKSNHKTRT